MLRFIFALLFGKQRYSRKFARQSESHSSQPVIAWFILNVFVFFSSWFLLWWVSRVEFVILFGYLNWYSFQFFSLFSQNPAHIQIYSDWIWRIVISYDIWSMYIISWLTLCNTCFKCWNNFFFSFHFIRVLNGTLCIGNNIYRSNLHFDWEVLRKKEGQHLLEWLYRIQTKISLKCWMKWIKKNSFLLAEDKNVFLLNMTTFSRSQICN